MSSLNVVWAIFVKDLRVEWRSRETLAPMCVFGLLVVFLFNFAFETAREETLRLLPGLLWIAFAFAGILGFNRSFAVAFWVLILAVDATSDALRGAASKQVVGGLLRVAGVSVVYTVVSLLLFE